MDLGRPKIYSIAVTILLFAILIALIFLEPGSSVFFVSALVIVTLFGLAHAFLEKKYLPNTRRHIATLLTLGTSLIAIAVYLLFNPYVVNTAAALTLYLL